MNKLFLTLGLISLTMSLTAGDFPDLTPPEQALLEKAAAQGIDSDFNALKALDPEAFKTFINRQTSEGESHLFRACWYGDIENATKLIAAGVNPFLTISKTGFFHTAGDTALNAACKKGPASLVELLLRESGRVRPQLINTTNEHGRSCLHDLCRTEIDLEKLTILLRDGGNVNLQDNEGNTPLYYAGNPKKNKVSQQEALTLLMRHGADTTILNKRGALPYAIGFFLDTVGLRALDAYSDEAVKIHMAQGKAAAAATATATEQKKSAALSICCPICLLEEEKNDSHAILASCNHSGHRACLDEWFKRDARCPLCRSTNITKK